MHTTSKRESIINWTLFIALCLIWGSSFILMKIGLQQLSAIQVAALRIASASIALLPFSINAFKTLPKNIWRKVFVSGLLGSFIPAFLFCFAEVQLSSAITGMINSLTPLFTVIVGVIFFKTSVKIAQYIGMAIGLMGLLLLIAPNGHFGLFSTKHILYVVLATIMYALNVNLVSQYLKGFTSTAIASMAFSFLLIPSVTILVVTGFFQLALFQKSLLVSTIAASVLGIIGTAFASVLFYMLVKRASALFASMVTYGIPIVALFWGIIFKETIVALQFVGLGIILVGVYLVNKKK